MPAARFKSGMLSLSDKFTHNSLAEIVCLICTSFKRFRLPFATSESVGREVVHFVYAMYIIQLCLFYKIYLVAMSSVCMEFPFW